MGRKPMIDENGIKRGPWSSEEDDKLRAFVLRYGHRNWRQLPKFAGLSRCGKSCRLRWLNYLRKDVKRGNYTKEEEDNILSLHQEHGNKWSFIAARLPGRTDNDIKNYWHSRLKRSAPRNLASYNSDNITQGNIVNTDATTQETLNHIVEDKISTEENNNIVDISAQQNSESFKKIVESTCSELPSDFNSVLSEDINLFSEASSSSFDSTGNFWTEPFFVDGLYDESYASSCSLEGSFVSPCTSFYDQIEYFDDLLFSN